MCIRDSAAVARARALAPPRLGASTYLDTIEPAPAFAAGELAKYAVALGGQFGLMAAGFVAIDALAARALAAPLPAPAVGVLFAFLSLRSRVFSLMDNSRPNREAQGGGATPKGVKRPAWTPPGVAFPIIWSSITVLRAVASALVYARGARALASAPLLCMALHLAVGDVWNTVTNIERRLGVSAAGCVLVWASVVTAVAQYARVSATAGLVLAPSAVWISVACVLTATIWRMNPPIQPLYPAHDGKGAPLKVRGESSLRCACVFRWLNPCRDVCSSKCSASCSLPRSAGRLERVLRNERAPATTASEQRHTRPRPHGYGHSTGAEASGARVV